RSREDSACFECVPWNDPDRAGALQGLARHSVTDGHAVSEGGAFIAWTPVSGPVNQLRLMDIERGVSLEIRHPSELVKLSDPAFSPDERFVAFVATPPPYFGVGEIWIVDLQRRSAARVDLPPCSSPRHPSLSENAEAVFYSNSVSPCPTTNFRPEYRGRLVYSLFYTDVESYETTRLMSESYFIPVRTRFSTGRVLVSFLNYSDGYDVSRCTTNEYCRDNVLLNNYLDVSSGVDRVSEIPLNFDIVDLVGGHLYLRCVGEGCDPNGRHTQCVVETWACDDVSVPTGLRDVVFSRDFEVSGGRREGDEFFYSRASDPARRFQNANTDWAENADNRITIVVGGWDESH
uniref:hypothetical protein n=1 Tax=uncultured Maricaulis sp. TaxID=174710 RepID=UPI0030D7888A